jgi:pyridoxamine 5'-phosphate oxidase
MTISSDDDLYALAISKIETLLQRARGTSLSEPLAMSLATATAAGVPSVRIVLLRGFSASGLVFYTNTQSDKGRDLAENSQVALGFHWDELGEQLRVQGEALPVSAEEADAYWKSRPRDSKIGAWASQQSRDLQDMATLARSVDDFERQFEAQEVPRPAHWGGYRVVPHRIEFWSTRPARLHERLVYQRDDNGQWSVGRLFP